MTREAVGLGFRMNVSDCGRLVGLKVPMNVEINIENLGKLGITKNSSLAIVDLL